jgi:cellobiose-specific phosphotransferase system component IIA
MFAPFPNFQLLFFAQSMVAVRAIFAAEDGRFEAALATLERDSAIHRRSLASGHQLIVKMVAARALERNLLLASELMHRHGAAMTKFSSRLARLAAPLGAEARAVRPMLETELALSSHAMFALKQMPRQEFERAVGSFGVDGLLLAMAYLPNASANRTYGIMQPMLELDAMSPAAIPAAIATASAESERRLQGVAGYSPRNFIGRALISVAGPKLDQYVYRLIDLDGLTRLVSLQIMLLEKNAIDVQIPDFLIKSDAAFADPYTGKPMVWDEKSRTVSFETKGRKSVGDEKGARRFSVRL